MNHAKTFMLLAALTALFVGIGYLLGGPVGMVIAFGVAIAMNAFSYWNADKLVLRMYKAQLVDEAHPDALIRNFVTDVKDMAAGANLPIPRIGILPQDQPNAFATGRNPENAVVCATVGLLKMLTRDEIRGVMAHELAHVKNRDTLTMTVTATVAGAITMLANFALFFGGRDRPGGLIGTLAIMFLAPMAAALVQMAISRSREYEADRVGAEIAHDPQSLASALAKIEGYSKRIMNEQAERNPASGQLFIINPLSGQRADNLFATHPNTKNRIEALMKMSGNGLRPAPADEYVTAVPPTQPPAKRGPWG